MRKLLSILMVVSTLCVPVFARAKSEIDLTEFQGIQGFVFEYDDMDDTVNVYYENSDELTENDLLVTPAVKSLTVDKSHYILYAVCIAYFGSDLDTFDQAIIRTSTNRYFISVLNFSNVATIPVGEQAAGMMMDIYNSTEPVKLRLSQGETKVDFVLTEKQIKTLVVLLGAYARSGCGDEDTLNFCDKMCPIETR